MSVRRTVEDCIPLNVKSYRQGFLKLQGWITFSSLAFLTGGLLVLYELLIINVEDQDFRDMLLDYRLTYDGVRYQHKYFANAQYCCHDDPAVFGYSCAADKLVAEAFGSEGPPCPPVMEFTCPHLASRSCNHVQDIVYPAVGLDNTNAGQPVDCNKSGNVLLRAKQGSVYTLAIYSGGDLLQELPFGTSISSVNAQQAQEFISSMLQQYSDPFNKVPSSPVSLSLSVDGQPVKLRPHLDAATWDLWGQFGWPPELWPWPTGPAVCSKTGKSAALSFEGSYQLAYSPAINNRAQPQAMVTATVYQSSITVPQYRIIENREVLSIQALSGVNLTIGMLAPLNGCEAWQIHKPSTELAYDTVVWTGSAGELQNLQQPIVATSQDINVDLHDISEPQPLALPKYHGELYIFVALAMGGAWMISTGLLIIMLGVLWLNVQRNRGLPIFFYKYMRQYRGW